MFDILDYIGYEIKSCIKKRKTKFMQFFCKHYYIPYRSNWPFGLGKFVKCKKCQQLRERAPYMTVHNIEVSDD